MPVGQANTASIVVWLLVLLGLVIGLFALVLWVRRKIREPDEASTPGFTLGDLRELHRQGKLTADEYERAKAAILASLKPKEGPPKGSSKNI